MDENLRNLERLWQASGDPEDFQKWQRALRRAVGPFLEPPRYNFYEMMLPFDPNWDSEDSYHSVEEYLQRYTPLEILVVDTTDSYQGREWGVLLFRSPEGPIYILWDRSFGSCESCDSWAAYNSERDFRSKWEYVRQTLSGGNSRQFWNFNAMHQWISDAKESDEYYLVSGLPNNLIERAKAALQE